MSTAKTRAAAVAWPGRLARIFFMYVGSFLGVFAYFNLAGRAQDSAAGIQHALGAALLVHSTYVLIAFACGEFKQFDLGLWILFAAGWLSFHGGVPAVQMAFEHESPALVPAALGVTALVPLLLGRRPFTLYFASRQTPPWQQKLPIYGTINRVITGYWVVLFFCAAGLAAWAPTDWRFTLLYPNLLLFGVGMVGGAWIPGLYLKGFPPPTPEQVEALIMGMPFVFDRHAAGDARAVIQFCVSGPEPGDYYVRVAGGRCESFEGRASNPDLTIRTPSDVWRRVIRGELDASEALQDGSYQVEGDPRFLGGLRTWFSRPG